VIGTYPDKITFDIEKGNIRCTGFSKGCRDRTMTINKKKMWKIAFYICVALYAVNMVCIFVSGNCIFINSSKAYNYITAVLNAVFLFIFYNFLKKGSLTPRYLLIMFGALVVLPFLIALVLGGIGFS